MSGTHTRLLVHQDSRLRGFSVAAVPPRSPSKCVIAAAARVRQRRDAVFHAEDEEPTALLKDVLVDGTATHGHPRALVGAAAYAFATWWLLRAQHTVGFGELLTVLLDSSSTWGAATSSAKKEWFGAANRSLGDYERLWARVVDETRQLILLARTGSKRGRSPTMKVCWIAWEPSARKWVLARSALRPRLPCKRATRRSRSKASCEPHSRLARTRTRSLR